MSAIKKYAKTFATIIALMLLSVAVAAFILVNERLRFPFFQATPKTLKAEFSTAQAVTPGQGQTVRISGVRIGDLKKVELKDGIAVITMSVDPKYFGRIHTDAHALLRPRTGLKDMFVELYPGRDTAPKAKENFTIPLANTEPDVNLDEILSSLDTDTRSYLQLLVNGAGQGLKGRHQELAEVFRRFEPTHRDLARFSKALATRRHNLRRLVTSLAVLNKALADRRSDLVQLVDASAATFHALASENGNISRTLALLPGTLRQTTDTLRKVDRLAKILPPAARTLIPAIHEIPAANRALSQLARDRTDDVRDEIRPFVRASRPLVRSLRPVSIDLAASAPHLTQSMVVLNHLFNTLAFNPRGREGPSNPNRQEGFLFWLAWLNHNAVTLFSSQDANGGWRPLFLTMDCATITETALAPAAAGGNPAATFALNLLPFLYGTSTHPSPVCNGTAGSGGGVGGLTGGTTGSGGAVPGGLPLGLRKGVKAP